MQVCVSDHIWISEVQDSSSQTHAGNILPTSWASRRIDGEHRQDAPSLNESFNEERPLMQTSI